jgi:hypothetical protein
MARSTTPRATAWRSCSMLELTERSVEHRLPLKLDY